jgi:large subunit ribosomal protein L21
MYAIIKTGGKQYFVTPGDRLYIEKLEAETGDKIKFDKVLYLSADDSAEAGTPYLDAVRVFGTVIENGKAKKVVTFKYKAKKDYRKKQGHRQPYSLVEIDSVTSNGKIIAEKPVIAAPESADEDASASDVAAEETVSEAVAVTAAEPAVESAEPKTEDIEPEAVKEDISLEAAEEKPPVKKATRAKAVKPDAAKTEDDKAETAIEKPAAKKPSKPRTPKKDAEKSDAAEAEEKPVKPAVKRTPKPKAEKPAEKTEEQESAAEKPADDKGDNL